MGHVEIDSILSQRHFLKDVKALWGAHRKSLGFFPDGAFEAYADKDQILVAHEDGRLAGYLLYNVTQKYARITHLCIESDYRGTGSSEALFEELRRRVGHLESIRLNCRRDYTSARQLWQRLGFVWDDSFAGKSKDGSELEAWRYPLSSLPLLQLIASEADHARIHAVVDCNVFSDLMDDTPTSTESDWIESNALQADAFVDVLQLEVTDETRTELSRIKDSERRDRRLVALNAFPQREYEPSRARRVEDELKASLPDPTSEQDLSDIRQISKATASDADVFVTRDEWILKRREDIEQICEIKVLRPLELLVRLDEDERPHRYQPSRLAGTHIEHRVARSEDISECIERFLNYGKGEGKAKFRSKLQRFLTSDRYTATLVESQGPEDVGAFWVVGRTERGRWHCPIIRVSGRAKLASTIGVHLVWNLMMRAAQEGLSVVQVDDQYISTELANAFRLAEFTNRDGEWFHMSLPGLHSVERLHKKLSDLELAVPKQIWDGTTELHSSNDVALAERLIFPGKVLRGLLPCFIVAIKPNWARELFDTDIAEADLFGADDKSLKLSFENVYYRSAHQSIVSAPGRIMWYVTQDDKIPQSGAIRAVSQVREVVKGTATEVFSRFRRLGVYEWANIRDTAGGKHKPIRAIRFSHTELLPNPISVVDYKAIANETIGKCSTLNSPWAVPEKLFSALYEAGHQPGS